MIGDLIDVGVDILNPVQVSAVGMDSAELKKEFGADLTFWGGAVDTQRVLGTGSVQDVKDDVRRRIDDLAPAGGFVFAAVIIFRRMFLGKFRNVGHAHEYGIYSS